MTDVLLRCISIRENVACSNISEGNEIPDMSSPSLHPQKRLVFGLNFKAGTCDEAEQRLDVGPVLEIRPTETVPDDVRHFLHQLSAGAGGSPAVLGQVHRPADLSRKAFVQCRNHPQLHCGEARRGTVWLQRLKPNPGDVYGDDPVHSQEVFNKAQNQ